MGKRASGDARVPSFEDFQQRTGRKLRTACAVCILPPEVKHQAERAWAAGHRESFLLAYLEDVGHPMGHGSIGHHFRSPGHRR